MALAFLVGLANVAPAVWLTRLAEQGDDAAVLVIVIHFALCMIELALALQVMGFYYGLRARRRRHVKVHG